MMQPATIAAQPLHYGHHVVGQGIDTLKVNALGDLSAVMVEALDTLQAQAIAERDSQTGRHRAVEVETPWRIAGQPLLMLPHGAGKGQWRWLLRCPAVTLELGAGRLNEISCRATLSSTFLWRYGYRQAWEKVRRLLGPWFQRTEDETKETRRWQGASAEIAPVRYQVSEVHLCADVAGLGVFDLTPADFVHRGTVMRWYQDDAETIELVKVPSAQRQQTPDVQLHLRYRELEGLTFSQTAPHSATLYNKPREIRLKSGDKIWFADIWRRNGWNGEDPITRVEMRYERELLHECGCETVEGTFDQLDALWAYSTQQWLRHTAPDPTDRNRSRWPTSPWWEVVQAASFGRPQTAPAQRQRAHAFHEARILATILGYLESWEAYQAGKAVPAMLDLSTVLRDLYERAEVFYAERGTDYRQEVLKRRKHIGFVK